MDQEQQIIVRPPIPHYRREPDVFDLLPRAPGVRY